MENESLDAMDIGNDYLFWIVEFHSENLWALRLEEIVGDEKEI